MANPPNRLPRGIADHASTLAILITRPSMLLGTMAWRRLPVLMLKRMPSPDAIIQMNNASQYQRVNESTTVSKPSNMSALRATLLNDQRLRSGPAASESMTMPMLPAE